MLALAVGNHLNAAIAMEGLAALAHHLGDERVAQNRFQEALHLYRGVGDQLGIASCLAGLAAAAAGQGRAGEAATLLGAASKMCDAQVELELPSLTEEVASLRSTMGDEAFDAAWQSGWAMPIDQVIDQNVVQSRSRAPRLAPLP